MNFHEMLYNISLCDINLPANCHFAAHHNNERCYIRTACLSSQAGRYSPLRNDNTIQALTFTTFLSRISPSNATLSRPAVPDISSHQVCPPVRRFAYGPTAVGYTLPFGVHDPPILQGCPAHFSPVTTVRIGPDLHFPFKRSHGHFHLLRHCPSSACTVQCC
jgi:hypothetical protein